jgi:hypothetical protein
MTKLLIAARDRNKSGRVLGFTLEGIIGLTNLFWICAVTRFILTGKWML